MNSLSHATTGLIADFRLFVVKSSAVTPPFPSQLIFPIFVSVTFPSSTIAFSISKVRLPILVPQIILQRHHVTTTVLVLAEQVVHTRHADEVLRSHRPMDGVDVGLLLRGLCQALRAA
jgi:hypothetical protein